MKIYNWIKCLLCNELYAFDDDMKYTKLISQKTAQGLEVLLYKVGWHKWHQIVRMDGQIYYEQTYTRKKNILSYPTLREMVKGGKYG